MRTLVLLFVINSTSHGKLYRVVTLRSMYSFFHSRLLPGYHLHYPILPQPSIRRKRLAVSKLMTPKTVLQIIFLILTELPNTRGENVNQRPIIVIAGVGLS